MKVAKLIGLDKTPDIKPGHDLAQIISENMVKESLELVSGDIVVISSKIVSKAENRIIDLNYVSPGKKAKSLSQLTGKDAARIQVILEEAEQVVGYLSLKKLVQDRGFVESYFGNEDAHKMLQNNEAVLFTVMPSGQLMTDGGTDFSNVKGKRVLSLLPRKPMESAEEIRTQLESIWNCSLGVVVSDSEIRALRQGTADIAIGYSGITPLEQGFGKQDLYGEPTFGGVDSICDQIANSAALLMGQRDENVPVVILKGLANFQENYVKIDSKPELPYSYMARFIKEVAISRFKLYTWPLLALLRND
ncbi:coenzyme F420-0:L-glutamate ligase [Natranaerobius thermophilus]|uniref:Coenzyme F420:L-glutamate ligase-like domain-containing protein n=1 Tax=Natranaerobius thermophilus (strain ATCC BAA-1301 / DSM 18059 / JW/NM-WN-LF) TaxID=457570 RepID=B2A6U2_NATTJ|nr:coenzyme F420-0:L-glutamate ligase [Natranaerobius thermophilus]ACB84223.1 protein of unknown function DUF129 [Natranaerobius thermophilus JW/NM-WN-LF]